MLLARVTVECFWKMLLVGHVTEQCNTLFTHCYFAMFSLSIHQMQITCTHIFYHSIKMHTIGAHFVPGLRRVLPHLHAVGTNFVRDRIPGKNSACTAVWRNRRASRVRGLIVTHPNDLSRFHAIEARSVPEGCPEHAVSATVWQDWWISFKRAACDTAKSTFYQKKSQESIRTVLLPFKKVFTLHARTCICKVVGVLCNCVF